MSRTELSKTSLDRSACPMDYLRAALAFSAILLSSVHILSLPLSASESDSRRSLRQTCPVGLRIQTITRLNRLTFVTA